MRQIPSTGAISASLKWAQTLGQNVKVIDRNKWNVRRYINDKKKYFIYTTKKRSAGYKAAGINLCAAIKYFKIRKVVSKKAEKLIYSL